MLVIFGPVLTIYEHLYGHIWQKYGIVIVRRWKVVVPLYRTLHIQMPASPSAKGKQGSTFSISETHQESKSHFKIYEELKEREMECSLLSSRSLLTFFEYGLVVTTSKCWLKQDL